MRIRDLLIFVIGAAVGGSAVLYRTTPRGVDFPHIVAAPETVRILVAKRPLARGDTLMPDDLQWVEWPGPAVRQGAFTSLEALFGEGGTARRIALRRIEPGEPILDAKITRLRQAPDLPAILGEGMRAVSIQVEETTITAGFVAPGDRVDFLLTQMLEGKLVSRLVVLDVEVLAFDGRTIAGTPDPRSRTTVTVAVYPRQAQLLALAQQAGRLSLILRGPDPPPEFAPNLYPDRIINPDVRKHMNDFPIPPGVFPGADPPAAGRGRD